MSETNKTITLVTKAANDLNKQSIGLQKTIDSLHSMEGTAATLAAEIEYLESQHTLHTKKIESELRDAKADLQIQIKESRQSVLATLMDEANFAEITNNDLSDLRDECLNALESNQDAIDAAVNMANKSNAISSAATKTELDSKHAVVMAEHKASNTALRSEIDFVRQSLKDIKDNVEAERAANIEIEQAKATAIATATANARPAPSK